MCNFDIKFLARLDDVGMQQISFVLSDNLVEPFAEQFDPLPSSLIHVQQLPFSETAVFLNGRPR